jgi:predicted transcriptional regulator
MNSTTLKISHKIKNILEKEKNHPKETLESVIARLLKAAHEDDKLSAQTIKNIEEGIADIKAGRVYTTEQLNKELGL